MPKRQPTNPGSLGHRISQVQAYSGVTQRGLAARLGVSHQAISQLISGKMRGEALLERMAIALSADPIWLRTGLGSPPWEAKVPNTYSGLLDLVKRTYALWLVSGKTVALPESIRPHDFNDGSWRPQPMPLLQLAKTLDIKVEFEKSIIDSYRSRMPLSVGMAAAQALQMALSTCEEQDREKFRAALNWVEKATSE